MSAFRLPHARRWASLVAVIGVIALAACRPDVARPSVAEDGGDGDAAASPPRDRDGDGYTAGIDCDDDDDSVHPGADEICDDGADNDCDGSIDTDLECLSACERAVFGQSSFGCEFYAADLPQEDTTKLFALSVSNPSDTDAATVTISTRDGVVAALVVDPRGVETYEDAARGHYISGSGITDRMYRITSDAPIAVFQFNSLETIDAASTDASLLFPTHTLAEQYYAMDYTASRTEDSFVAVYATRPDTEVLVFPTGPINGWTSAGCSRTRRWSSPRPPATSA